MFWVISVYFNIRNTLPKSCRFLLGHPVFVLLTTFQEANAQDSVVITEAIVLILVKEMVAVCGEN